MSSLGGQWRALRDFISEAERILQRIRSLPDPRQNVLKKIQPASVSLSQDTKEVNSSHTISKDGATMEADNANAPPKEVVQSAQGATQAQIKDAKTIQDPMTKVVDDTSTISAPPPAPSPSTSISLEGLLNGLRLKKDLSLGQVSHPGWKHNKRYVNNSCIHSRTAYVISALVDAQSGASVGKRVEDFLEHINHYPEARDLAIKEGAVRALLRAESRVRGNPELEGLINEALAITGHVGAPRGPGPAILSLDGGGVRGLIAIELLRYLERLTGRRVTDLFDYVIGVSTGAIIAAVIGGGVGNLETASKLYHTLSKEMFGNTSIIGGTSRLVWSHSYYDTAAWEKMLRDNLGDRMLTHCNRTRNPKMALVSCVVSGSKLSPFLFRTYSGGWRVRAALRGTSKAALWQAVRASAAAPTYFAELALGGELHQDGGLVVNNPAGAGVHEARALWGPGEMSRGTVVSLGTGRVPPAPAPPHDRPPPPTSWRDKFNTILDSATDTEGVHLMLNDLLPSGSYFRLNPPLTEPCAMDEIDPRRINNMLADTHAYIRRNQHKLEECARRLTKPRGISLKVADAVHIAAVKHGLRN